MVKPVLDWNESLVSEEFYMDVPLEYVEQQAENIAKRLNEDLLELILQKANMFGGQEVSVTIEKETAGALGAAKVHTLCPMRA